MGFFDKLKGNSLDNDENVPQTRNIGKITSDAAGDILKELSGGEIKYSKKLIDNVIVFTNASGGTGASTIAANVAWIAKSQGLRVAVLDLNIMHPIQHLYFDVKQELQKPDLAGFLLGKNSIGEAIEQTKSGVSLIYANNRGIADAVACETDAAADNLAELISKLRQLFDIVVIDCPMEVNNLVSNTTFYIADAIYLIWDENIASIVNTEKIRRNLASTGIDAYTKMRVILNKRTTIQYTNYPFEKLNIELLGILPFESDIIYSGIKSEIFVDKGASRSKNAGIFYNNINEISSKIFRIGGYMG